MIEEVLNEVSFEDEDRVMQYVPRGKASERGVGSFSGVTLSQEMSKDRIVKIGNGVAKYEPVLMSVVDQKFNELSPQVLMELAAKQYLAEQSRRSGQSQGKPKSAISLSQKTAN